MGNIFNIQSTCVEVNQIVNTFSIFFNPKNYISIFSTLPKLDKGNEIFVNYDGITYKYRVDAMFEVRPNDIQILEQSSDSSYLTLVTCVPPGDPRKLKRLIIRAKLVKGGEANATTGN